MQSSFHIKCIRRQGDRFQFCTRHLQVYPPNRRAVEDAFGAASVPTERTLHSPGAIQSKGCSDRQLAESFADTLSSKQKRGMKITWWKLLLLTYLPNTNDCRGVGIQASISPKGFALRETWFLDSG